MPSRNVSSSTLRTASSTSVERAAAYTLPHGFRFARIVAIAIIAWPALLLAHPGHGVALFASAAVPAGPRPAARPVTAPPRTDARLSVTINDATLGRPTPVRIRITDETGMPLGPPPLAWPRMGAAAIDARLSAPGTVLGLPPEAIGIMYGQNDAAQGYAFQPDGSFYVAGSFELPMPAGKFWITITKGYEYVAQTEELVFQPGDHLVRTYELHRWVDMPGQGWYSADDHIHIRRSVRDNPLIRDWIAAEDVHVGVMLQMGDFWTTYFAQYAWGEKGLYQDGSYILTSGQEEPRTRELGHTISFGARDFVRFPDEYFLYDKAFDRVHELDGVTGYAHQGVTFHGYRGLTLDVLGGKVDFLELMQFCVRDGPLALEHYYRFLDLGYKLTALAGSDFPWCGRGLRPGEASVGPRIGDARFYTYVGSPFSFARWLDGVKAGNTFVTTGPVIDFKVSGRLPGSSLDLELGTKLRISAVARGHPTQIPLQRLQLIGHGKVLAEVRPGEPGQTPGQLGLELDLDVNHGIWLAARADAGPAQLAHTTPVYVTVEGDGFHNRSNLIAQIEAAQRALDEIRDLLVPPGETSPSAGLLRFMPAPAHYPGTAARLEQRIQDAESKLEELRNRQ